MMKQASTPIQVDLSTGFHNNSDITDTELMFQLTKSTKDAILLSNDKKKFFLSVQKNKKNLLHYATIFDSALGSDVYNCLNTTIPSSSRIINRELEKSELAELIIRLLKPLVIVRNYLKSQYDAERPRKPKFRESTANKHQMKSLRSTYYLKRSMFK